MKYFLGLDNGGTTTKAAIYDREGKEICVASVETKMIVPAPGFVERDMDEMWEANCTVTRNALEKSGIDPADIAGVGICGHGKGLYLWGKDNRPLRNGIISTDNRIKLSVLSSFYKVSSIFAKSIISCLWIIRSNTLVASYCRKG